MTRSERYAARVQREISYCYNCQARDSGDWVWVLGDQTELESLLDQHGVPEALRDDVAALLSCPHCGTSLERGVDVGLPTSEERDRVARWDEWTRRFAEDVQAFGDHLTKYPYLGLKHPIGRRIASSLTKFPTAILEKGTWWRARKAQGKRIFSKKDLFAPPPKLARAEGRFNHFGQVVLYLASTRDASITEALNGARSGYVWCQSFELPDVPGILDLLRPEWYNEASLPVLAMGLVDKLPTLVPDDASPWKPEYFVPRFIADCAREAGLAGIRFSSRHHIDSNLVLFDWKTLKPRPVGKPKKLLYREPELPF